jgi:hypothetical protein
MDAICEIQASLLKGKVVISKGKPMPAESKGSSSSSDIEQYSNRSAVIPSKPTVPRQNLSFWTALVNSDNPLTALYYEY